MENLNPILKIVTEIIEGTNQCCKAGMIGFILILIIGLVAMGNSDNDSFEVYLHVCIYVEFFLVFVIVVAACFGHRTPFCRSASELQIENGIRNSARQGGAGE